MMSVAIVGVVFGGPVARAQQAVPVPAAIVGVVVDTAGSPIGDVELITGAGRRSTVSARDGSFRLAFLPGRYAVVHALGKATRSAQSNFVHFTTGCTGRC